MRCSGGSGHEPAFGGFVGHGLLTAAVCGDVFASPPVGEILAAIKACTSDAGCLLVIMNYTARCPTRTLRNHGLIRVHLPAAEASLRAIIEQACAVGGGGGGGGAV
jgi:hypothetical protein